MPVSGIGIEVGPRHLRALRVNPRGAARTEAMEVEWATHPPEESIRALRERFGSGNVLAVALDMSVVFVKRVGLPPLPAEERRRMIAMDPSRYFPIRNEALVAGVREDDLVVATREAPFDSWMDVLDGLGSVERVEPAASSLVRHLAHDGVRDGLVVMTDPAGGETTLARVADGRVEALRKVRSDTRELAGLASTMAPGAGSCVVVTWQEDLARELRARLPRTSVGPAPHPPGAPESFAVAHGALLGLEGAGDLTLSSAALVGRLQAARRRRAVVHGVGLGAALVLLGWSADYRRDAALQALEERIAAVEAEAGPVLELRSQARVVADELGLLAREAAQRSNPLEALLAVTRLLPPDAHLSHFTAIGDEWELNGLARDAARLIPLLEQSDLFADVRFRTATTRVRVANEFFESFSVVLRNVPST